MKIKTCTNGFLVEYIDSNSRGRVTHFKEWQDLVNWLEVKIGEDFRI